MGTPLSSGFRRISLQVYALSSKELKIAIMFIFVSALIISYFLIATPATSKILERYRLSPVSSIHKYDGHALKYLDEKTNINPGTLQKIVQYDGFLIETSAGEHVLIADTERIIEPEAIKYYAKWALTKRYSYVIALALIIFAVELILFNSALLIGKGIARKEEEIRHAEMSS